MKQWDDLGEVYQAIWRKLERAVKDRREGWHLLTVATLRNTSPELRTVVLRGVSQEKNSIWFHTDLRSPKALDIKTSPHGSLLFYDPKHKWQLRLRGVFSFDSLSEETETVWKKTSESAKRCYQGPFAPGTLSENYSANLPESSVGSDFGRENFTRVFFKIHEMDWLYLRALGHQRALWYDENPSSGTWVNP